MSNDTIPKVIAYMDVVNHLSGSTFRSHFRVTKTTFEILLNHLSPCREFQKRNAALGGREQITVEKTLLLILWILATPESYRSVADRFNVGKGTIVHLMKVFVDAVLNNLCQVFIKWPNEFEKRQISAGFSHHGLPNIIGIIDGCHIPIERPIQNPFDYYNRKKFYSVVLQAICKHNLMFIDCDVRWPGSVHDSRVLRTSDFYPYAEELCAPNYFILGDSAYPVKSWLIPPFKKTGNLTQPQVYFNTHHAKTRVAIENAFSLLKGRFRRLKKLEMKHVTDIVRTIICCCVLHNICIVQSDEDLLEYIREGKENDPIRMVGGIGQEAQNGNARDRLVEYLWNNRRQRN